MTSVTLARQAMATRFEMILCGEHPAALRAAGEEALDEIERLEAQLSLYRSGSEVARLNARAAQETIRVEPGLFRLLEHAQRLHRETNGAFDITIGPLMRCWGFMGGSGQLASPDKVAQARSQVGMDLVQLNPRDFTVHFLREGVTLDLGAIGKGYAIEQAADILEEAGVTRGLLHGGTSTIRALGAPPDSAAWKVGINVPQQARKRSSPAANAGEPSERNAVTKLASPIGVGAGLEAEAAADSSDTLAVLSLCDEALSVSAVEGKFFEASGRVFGHVIDPHTGEPTSRAVLAAVVLPSATESDALSTALLTTGSAGLAELAAWLPDLKAIVLEPGREPGQYSVRSRGFPTQMTVRAKVNGFEVENRN